MKSTIVATGCAMALALASPVQAEEADAAAIVNGQFVAGGNKPGGAGQRRQGRLPHRAVHASAEAAGLSKAPHFAKPVPVTARFSMGGSNPNVSDKAKPVTRGFAMRLRDPAGDLVLVIISAPVFSARTPQQLFDFVSVRAPGPDGKPDAEKVKAFAAANPETTKQAAWLNARPVPASYAGVDYWGVHAYTLTNAKGEAQVVKLKTVADAGQLGLSEDDLKAKPDSFYADELKGSPRQGAGHLLLVAIHGEAGDPTADPDRPVARRQPQEHDARHPRHHGSRARRHLRRGHVRSGGGPPRRHRRPGRRPDVRDSLAGLCGVAVAPRPIERRSTRLPGREGITRPGRSEDGAGVRR